MAATRERGREVFLVLAPVVLLAQLALWVASSGVVFVVGDPYRNLDDNAPEPTSEAIPPPPGPSSTVPTRHLPDPWWMNLGAWLTLAVGLISLGYLIYRLGQWLAIRRAPVTLVPRPAPAVAETVLADADEQFAALAGGRPSNAIITCWQRLEAAIEAAGSPAQPWETPAEVAAEVLREFDPDGEALADLLGLYREARFSAHELGESERARAVDALQRIHLGLERAARVVAERPDAAGRQTP